MRVLIAEPADFTDEAHRILSEVADVELRDCGAPELATAFGAYDAVWCQLRHRVDAAMLSAARCRFLVVPTTGLDHIDLTACAARGVRVLSLKGEAVFLQDVRATAEHTLALTLALLRRVPWAHADVLAGRWERDLFRGHELYQRRAGVVGCGRLGRIVGACFHALGMTVRGFDPRPWTEPAIAPAQTLHELLAWSDVVSIHVAYDDTTAGLIDASALAHMQRHAVLINTSRGGVISTSALIEALRGDRIAGAALDVLEGEPHVGSNHPLVVYARAHQNLLLTPHLGGNTYESFAKTQVFLARKLAAELRALPCHTDTGGRPLD